jgi:hypothetical protein
MSPYILILFSWDSVLSDPVDVYSDWIDACEAAQNAHDADNVPSSSRGLAINRSDGNDDDEDDFDAVEGDRHGRGGRNYGESVEEYGNSERSSRYAQLGRRTQFNHLNHHDLIDAADDVLGDELI